MRRVDDLMKLTELRAEIDALIEKGHGDLDVAVSSDAEGNNDSDFDEITIEYFNQFDEGIHPDDVEEYGEENCVKKAVIWRV